MFESMQYGSTKGVPKYELNSFVTMATEWISDLPNIRGISVHLWHVIFIFGNGALFARSSKHIDMLA